MPIESTDSQPARRQSRRCPIAPGANIEALEPRRLFSTFTVNASGGGANYTDLETAIVNSPAGSTLLVSPGTYTAHTTVIDPSASVFWINKALTIVSTSGPGSTILVAPAGQSQDLLISSSNVRVEGFSLQGGQFCADVQDFLNNTTLTNVVLKNLNLTPDASAGHGILFSSVSNSLIDGCVVGLSFANGIFLDAGSDNDIVQNCTVNGTVTQHAIAVKNSNNDQILDNTVTSSAFDGIILVTSSDCRVTDNNISGHKVDGITMTNDSDDNYIAQNTIVSNGLAMGRTDGSGIWMNDESDGNTVFANTTSGSPECGISAFVSSNNLIQGNEVFGNGEGGIFIWDAQGDATYTGNAPANTVIINNYIHNNLTNGAVNLRGASNTDVERNYFSGTFTGVDGSSTDAGLVLERSTGTQFIGNTLVNLQIGIYAYATAGSANIFRNRFFNIGHNYAFPGASVLFDGSVTLGGNFWSDQAAAGNPSTGTPYTKFVYDSIGDMGGGFIDNFPFQSETLGQAYSVTITDPAAGTSVAAGSTRTIQWTSTGSVLVDIYYSSSETGDVLIAANHADNGVYNWKVPSLIAASDYVIKIIPKNSAGVAEGAAAVSGTFTAAGTNNLLLTTPGRDMNVAGGSTMRVAWQAVAAGTSVDVDIQVNGGSSTNLASAITDDFVDVTLPNVNTNSARIRIRNHVTGAADTQDGFFRIGTTAAVNNITTGQNVLIGSNQLITWNSPAGSVTVDVQFWDGGQWRAIATRLPDLGHVVWDVPEFFTNGATVRIIFHDSTDAQISTVTSNSLNVVYSSTPGVEVPVYRLSNSVTLEHLYTTDLNEYAVLGTRGWTQEGSPFEVYNGAATVSGVADEPQYRLYDRFTFQHLWTTDRNEYLTLRTTGVWTPEGVANYIFPTAVASSTLFYRLSYNGPTLIHLWTTDLNEYDTLGSEGWTKEGSIGQVLT